MGQFLGAFIRRERLRKNYSQEGLCKGICVVSYLSKIENHQVEPSSEIIMQLLARLDIEYHADPIFLEEGKRYIDEIYERLFELNLEEKDYQKLVDQKSIYLTSPFLIDAMLILNYVGMKYDELSEYVSCMNSKQYEMYLYLECWKGRQPFEELLRRNNSAFYLFQAGDYYWIQGEYLKAVKELNHAYEAASESGLVYLMMNSQAILGNCYSSMHSESLMLKSYEITKRIARALNDEVMLEDIDYNIGATNLEWNHVEKAYEYFSKCKRTDYNFEHKYALCLERLGQKEKAKEALKIGRKDPMMKEVKVWEEIYQLVEYRLEHSAYRKSEEYHRKLIECMAHMKEELPDGYVRFHLPYLIEVLEAQRKYKEVNQLLKEYSLG